MRITIWFDRDLGWAIEIEEKEPIEALKKHE